jgi:hypothetical protein
MSSLAADDTIAKPVAPHKDRSAATLASSHTSRSGASEFRDVVVVVIAPERNIGWPAARVTVTWTAIAPKLGVPLEPTSSWTHGFESLLLCRFSAAGMTA